MTVTLENDDGEQREIEIGESEQTTCPGCGSTSIEFHRLNRVLAGECIACFNVWALGPLTDWEVVDE